MKKWWIWTALALVLCSGGGYLLLKRKPQEKSTYETASAARGNLTVKILSTGTVQPENRLQIKPPISGRVEKVLVEEGQFVRQGQTLALMSSTERAALLDAARAKGPEELKRWQDYYQPAPILAPLPGTIILRNVEPGQTVTSADALLVMSDRLTVKAQVDETDLAQIRLQQKAEIVLDAYPNSVVEAHVDQIAYDATTVNNVTTYIVDVLPNRTSSIMRSGMTANVSFIVADRSDVLLIPAAALAVKDGRSYVLVTSPDRKRKPIEQEIRAGISDGKHVEILSGLAEGTQILVPKIALEPSTKGTTNPFSPFAPRRGGGR